MESAGPGERLREAFLEDHQRFTRGLARLRDALRGDDLPRAVAAARALDADVGAHIEFEERHYYPALVEALGAAFVARLYAEHRTGREAVRALLGLEGARGLHPVRKDALLAAVEETMGHALSCGSLLSHLERLEDAEQARLLARLLELRGAQHRWTELPDARPQASAGA